MSNRRKLFADAITGVSVAFVETAFAQAADTNAQVNFSTPAGSGDDDKLNTSISTYGASAVAYKPMLVLDEAR